MFGWHHRLNGHEFEQALGDSEGQGSLMCCSPWGTRVGHDLVAEQQGHIARKCAIEWNLIAGSLTPGFMLSSCAGLPLASVPACALTCV